MEYLFLEDDAVVISDECGVVRKMLWKDLVEVVVQTTSAGPFADDVFFVLGSADGRKMSISSEMKGSDALLARLQGLAGFDNEKFIEATMCTEDRLFVCWRAPQV
ncbi:MAG: hypothetical protein K8T20_13805 [Planctomycetes bacterium]|nr:hypothetical protein [Planctomycetota bacterium]